MDAIEFLTKKGILKEGNTQFVIVFSDGKEIDLVSLFEEYALEKYDELSPGEYGRPDY